MFKDIKIPASFVGRSGRFYVRQTRADGSGHTDRVSVWPSVEDYDSRAPVPLCFCDAADALADFDFDLKIYPESLTTTPPPYPADRDETDFGLTPERNLWTNIFNTARRADRRAA